MEAKALAAESSINTSLTKDEALSNAILATELYMKAIKLSSAEHDRKRLSSKCKQLLSRAEEIKKADRWPPITSRAYALKIPLSHRKLSTPEEIILLESSKLHGFKFPPWKVEPQDSLFEGGDLYIDPAELKLSEAQKEIFAGWKRPTETFGRPPEPRRPGIEKDNVSMFAVNDVDLVQDITTDCSVVASLCAGTARASKGHETILSSMIYPYDKNNGCPRISPNGKYIFRFHFNGCFRNVTIDDRLPASNSSRCLHVIDRQNPELLWPALIEKAYLKVRGGYDFPGSNSGTDLWVMSGWIPEQIFLQSDDLQSEQLWLRIFKSFGFGDVMITLGTCKLTRKEERELGLAGEHDYAVLDLTESGSQRSLLIKNPWCDGMTWKGARSKQEQTQSEAIWSDELRQALPISSQAPGTFWMTFQEVVQNFESLYLNWNPGLFTHRQDHHFSWTIPPSKTPGSFTLNPQYSISATSKGVVWILLSRHFTTEEQNIMGTRSSPDSGVSSALGFISLYVFASDGYRVHLSDDAIHRGAYVDSPQTLARLELSPSTPLTVVVAQQSLPLPKYAFTLSLFSRSPLTVSPALDAFPHYTTHSGSWTLRTAGGNASAPSYSSNPQYSIMTPPSSHTALTLILEASDPNTAVHIAICMASGARVTSLTSKDILRTSGSYRRGCALASLQDVVPGSYTIVCSTFEPGQLGDFTLRIGSSLPCEVRPVPAESAGRFSLRVPRLRFEHQDGDRMLAPLSITRLTRLRIVARSASSTHPTSPPTGRSRPLIRVSLELGQGPNKSILGTSGTGTDQGEFSDAPMGVRTADIDINLVMSRRGGFWIVVERMGGSGRRGGGDEVDVEILSDSRDVNVGLWGIGDG